MTTHTPDKLEVQYNARELAWQIVAQNPYVVVAEVRDSATVKRFPNPNPGPENNARELARRWNAHAGLLAALEHIRDVIQGGDKFDTLEPWAQEMIGETINPALAAATAEGGEK